MWLSFINAAHSARQVIRMLFDAVGGSAIYSKKNPFIAGCAMPKPGANILSSSASCWKRLEACCSSQTTNNHSRFCELLFEAPAPNQGTTENRRRIDMRQ